MRTAAQQLVFNFGRSLLARINLLSDPGPKSRSRARRELRRDPMLEEVARVLLRQVGCRKLAAQISVCWNPRMRTTAGLACYTSKSIILNPRLIEVSAAEVQRTLRHELAHFVAQHLAGRRRIAPHGEEWKEACRMLGIGDEARCHQLPFKTRKMQRRFFYGCPECSTVVARVHAMKRQMACIRCCRKFNGGRYHPRFRFLPIDAPEREAA